MLQCAATDAAATATVAAAGITMQISDQMRHL